MTVKARIVAVFLLAAWLLAVGAQSAVALCDSSIPIHSFYIVGKSVSICR